MTPSPITHREPRSWLKITIKAPAALADYLADFLANLTGSGVEFGYAPEGREIPLEVISGYLANDQTLPGKKAYLERHLAGLNRQKTASQDPIRYSEEYIEEQDWNATWKEQFKPFHLTTSLVIKPSWEKYQPRAGEKIIEMDPGMAFGTGHHASTALALGLLDALFHGRRETPQTVLDVGTGTGILAMACALWGARRALAIDNDPDAVHIARENVRHNALEKIIRVTPDSLADMDQTFDIVAANITHDVLTTLARDLTSRLAPSGSLVLAGILRGDQEQGIQRTFEHLGLQTMETRKQDEWIAFLLKS